MQGRPGTPSPRWVIPVAGTLRLASGGVNFDFSTTTDLNGNFVINTALPPGDYLWRVKNAQTTANGGTTSLVAGLNIVEIGILHEGDAGNDNCIGITDFNILKPTNGRAPGEPGYDGRADFNGDNLVNINDFNLLKGNLGQCGVNPIIGDPTLTPTSTQTPTDTPTATNTPALIGHITVLGRSPQPSARQSVPLSVTLRISGGNAGQYDVTSDQSGFFTITSGLVPGVYTWRVKNPQTLANAGGATLVAGTNNVEMGSLIEGDATNDNCVTAPDFNAVKVTYGKSLGDPGYDARADFTGDNQVNVVDFNLSKVNFGQCGAAPITIH